MAGKDKKPSFFKKFIGSKEPRSAFPLSTSSPRISETAISSNSQKISWALSIFDHAGPWGICAIKESSWEKHLSVNLKGVESMTWNQILEATGGKSHGNASHFVKVAKISKKASDRLKEIKQEDTEDIFSLRIEGKVRIYGIRENAVLKIIWFDPWHDKKEKGVCPVCPN